MIELSPFDINYPLNIFNQDKKIDFLDNSQRDELIKRNIYYFNYFDKVNELLEQRKDKYYGLSQEVLKYLGKEYEHLTPLSISLFGSSLFSENPGDYDFLAITKGNDFLLDETSLKIGNKNEKVGISIKGIDNFTQGPIKNKDENSKRMGQVVNRTAIALFRRHLPLWGRDFQDNENEFTKNLNAQVSDLLHNTYELYYLDHPLKELSFQDRGKKILSRTYESLSYLNYLEKNPKLDDIRKNIYESLQEKCEFGESKELFDRVVKEYLRRIKND